MRITNSTLTTNYLRNLNKNLASMQKLQSQLSSGKVVTRPSEDPLLVSKIMDLRNTISTNEQYNSTITDTIGWVDTQDGALQGANSTVQRIRELIIYGANGTLSEDDRNAITEEVKIKVGELADVLNTNFDGRYIFSGTKTTDKPFNAALEYQGNDKNIKREISTGVEVELAVDGEEFTTLNKGQLDEQKLSDLLKNIITALEDGDSDALSGKLLGDLDKHIDNILSFRSKIGAISNRLDAAKERNEAENLNLKNLLSQREDIDLAQKYTEANTLNSVYLASLSIGAKILQPSLLDYLR
ncbi:MAG TPA: flagellar hook-associated protein FlgL [Soehngenia sp.]|nr:flagellar hook-associated protein FlgL [Soehngenia sp.]HPP31397.1 flagellar hook-associated protein FlgL [Soehngenia sp.]